MKTPRRRSYACLLTGICAVCVAVALCMPEWVLAQSPSGQDTIPRLKINLGYSAGAFSGVNRNDANAALKVWVESLAKRRGFEADVSTTIFENAKTLRAALEADEIDIMTFFAADYLEFEGRHKLVPAFVPDRCNGPQDRFMLMVHADSGLTEIAQLRGKSLIAQEASGAALGLVWLDTALLECGRPARGSFFGDVSSTHKVSTAVLQVFFKQTDACLISECEFRTLVELNPQIKTQVTPLAISPAYTPSVICVRDDYEGNRDDLIEGLRELHLDPSGRQLLAMFKVGRMVEYDPGHLNAAREILQRYETLKARYAGADHLGD